MTFILQVLINIILYIIIIYSVHIIWNNMKDNYTDKKVKDLQNIQGKKFIKMMDDINETEKMISPKVLSNNDIIKLNEDLENYYINNISHTYKDI